uniref:Uncharacterized protein n=1 Tax=virus sp. ctoYX9 TaxID=2825822 RepID=A0A8S5RPH3_9VIRU|nr:MAG TPA: hypothetical protein [virus sp. ctoYX9]
MGVCQKHSANYARSLKLYYRFFVSLYRSIKNRA